MGSHDESAGRQRVDEVSADYLDAERFRRDVK
jgi:hypothetical protein